MTEEQPIRELIVNPTKIGDFLIKCKIYDYSLEFEALECIGGPVKETGGWIYRSEDGDPVYNEADAITYMYGHIKWDGCMNIIFEEQTNSADRKDVFMLHYCGLDQFENTWKLMQQLYDLARANVPHWSE